MHTEITESPIDRVLAAFEAIGHEAEPDGKGYLACCPVHERGAGHNPSCHIEEQPSGKVTVVCRSSHPCDFEEIVKALGVEKSIFFPAKPKTAAAKKAAKKCDQEDAAKRAQEAARALAKAKALLSPRHPPHSKLASADHPYLARKQVSPENLYEATLEQVRNDFGYHPQGGQPKKEPLEGPTLLVVPMQDIAGNLTSVQVIDGTGRKSYLYGGPAAGAFWTAQKMPDTIDHDGPSLLIGEGVATVKSAVAAIGGLGVAALSEGNIEKVAKAMRGRYPETRIILLADVGAEDTCNDVAREIDASVAVPSGQKKTDWNDVAVRDGIEAVKAGIEAATKPAPEPASSAENVDVDPLSYQRTEQGIGKMFADMIRGTAHYVREWNAWAVWNGRHWQRDDRNISMLARTKDITVAFLDAAKKATGDGDARSEALTKFAVATQKLHFCEAVIAWAKTEPGIAVSAEAFDVRKDIIVFSNGTYDLEADEFRAHDRKDMSTTMLGYAYDPDAECPRYRAFQAEIQPDPEIRSFLQRWKGLALTGFTSEQKCIYKTGEGSNGKSLDNRIDMLVLGDYAITAASNMLVESKGGDKSFTGLLDTRGKRLLLADEVPRDRFMDTSVMKSLTGEDQLKDRKLYQNFEAFTNTAKLQISGNGKLRLRETGFAIRRRILLVEYGESFKDAKCDPTLFDKLKAELPGVFNYFLEGYRSWLERGLDVPTKIRADSETYVDANDAYGAFFRDHCEFDAKASCTRAEMYALYILWAKGEGFAFPLGPQALGNQLADRGVKEGPRKVIDGSRQRIWIGVKLTNTAELAVHSPKFAAALPANA